MSSECSNQQVLSIGKMLVVNEQKVFLFSSVFSRVLNEQIQSVYLQAHVSCFPGLISVAWVNEERLTDVARVLKAPGAEVYLYLTYIFII